LLSKKAYDQEIRCHHFPLLMFMFVFCIVTIGCASFQHSSYRTVLDSTTRDGSTEDRLDSYGPLKVVAAPTTASPILKVSFSKQLTQNIKYETKTHQEEVLKKEPTRFETNYKTLGYVAGLTAIGVIGTDNQTGRTIGLSVGGVIFAYFLFMSPQPPEETRYNKIAGSDGSYVTYREEKATVPAVGETLVMNQLVSSKTDSNGLATFAVENPKGFDSGVVIRHSQSNGRYVIRRIPRERTITKDWLETARKLELGIEAAHAIQTGVEAALEVFDPEVFIIATAAGVVLHILVEKLGTHTERYYEWVVIGTQ